MALGALECKRRHDVCALLTTMLSRDEPPASVLALVVLHEMLPLPSNQARKVRIIVHKRIVTDDVAMCLPIDEIGIPVPALACLPLQAADVAELGTARTRCRWSVFLRSHALTMSAADLLM